jgi:hypothetical protein
MTAAQETPTWMVVKHGADTPNITYFHERSAMAASAVQLSSDSSLPVFLRYITSRLRKKMETQLEHNMDKHGVLPLPQSVQDELAWCGINATRVIFQGRCASGVRSGRRVEISDKEEPTSSPWYISAPQPGRRLSANFSSGPSCACKYPFCHP